MCLLFHLFNNFRDDRKNYGGGGRDFNNNRDSRGGFGGGRGRGGRDNRRGGGGNFNGGCDRLATEDDIALIEIKMPHGSKYESNYANRAISPSRERSRARERKRRFAQRMFMKKSGYQSSRQDEYWDGFQWVPRDSLKTMNAVEVQGTRKDRRMHIGNIPTSTGVTKEEVQQAVFQAMVEHGLCSDPSVSPVLSCWIGPSFGFLDFASREDRDKALTLTNLVFVRGQSLRFSLPTESVGGAAPAVDASVAAAMGGGILLAMGDVPQSDVARLAMEEAKRRGATTVVKVHALVDSAENDEEWREILMDALELLDPTKDSLGSWIVSSPEQCIAPHSNVGDVFVHFPLAQQAVICLGNMAGKSFDGKAVHGEPFDKNVFLMEVKPFLTRNAQQHDNYNNGHQNTGNSTSKQEHI